MDDSDDVKAKGKSRPGNEKDRSSSEDDSGGF